MPLYWKRILLLIFISFNRIGAAQLDHYVLKTIAFYNVENLFDPVDNPDTADDDYTPNGKNQYTAGNYFTKIEQTAKVLSEIGSGMTGQSPVLIGLAEIENFTVINDLIQTKFLSQGDYQIIHKDSPDHRGIDVALIYQQSFFQPLVYEFIEVKLWNDKGQRLFTRDILYVFGIYENHGLHLFVNHWPSRRGGAIRSEPKRIKAAYQIKQKTDAILLEDPLARIVIMGDFNDDPIDKSIVSGLLQVSDTERKVGMRFINPMTEMYKKGGNTLVYRDGINLFDQIIISDNLLRNKTEKGDYFYFRAGIYNPPYLISNQGKYKGYPLRSFSNNRFSNGYSDHFPVYIELLKQVKNQGNTIPN